METGKDTEKPTKVRKTSVVRKRVKIQALTVLHSPSHCLRHMQKWIHPPVNLYHHPEAEEELRSVRTIQEENWEKSTVDPKTLRTRLSILVYLAIPIQQQSVILSSATGLIWYAKVVLLFLWSILKPLRGWKDRVLNLSDKNVSILILKDQEPSDAKILWHNWVVSK